MNRHGVFTDAENGKSGKSSAINSNDDFYFLENVGKRNMTILVYRGFQFRPVSKAEVSDSWGEECI